ncbi:MAG TPA: hypothetical protein VIW92_00270, partial [Thermoanaerobaculia bacterium]
MSFHDTPGDVEAEAHASSIIFSNLPEALEDGLKHVAGYTRSGVADAETKLVSRGFATNPDSAALRGELDRVRNHIGKHLKHPIVVEFRQKRAGGKCQVSRLPTSPVPGTSPVPPTSPVPALASLARP